MVMINGGRFAFFPLSLRSLGTIRHPTPLKLTFSRRGELLRSHVMDSNSRFDVFPAVPRSQAMVVGSFTIVIEIAQNSPLTD